MLFTKASDFEKTSYSGLFHFVRYMELLEKYEVDYGEADTLDENADVVRIMSIHKSKGLEFPVTFVCGMGKQFNVKDTQKALIVDPDLGLGVTFVDVESRIKCKTLRQRVIAKKMVEDLLAEELRVLYVALTRAKEKLILTGVLENAGEAWKAWQENVTEQLEYPEFIGAKGYMELLLPVLANTDFQVKVLGEADLKKAAVLEQVDLKLRRTELEQIAQSSESGEVTELEQRLAYAYPHKNLEKLYTKTTVSELKAEAMAERDEEAHELFESREKEAYVPSFAAAEQKISGTLRGSAFHRAMEILDLEALLGGEFGDFPSDYDLYRERLRQDNGSLNRRIGEFLKQQTECLKLSREYYEAVNPRKVEAFLQTESAYRMWRADRENRLYREQPFVLGIDAGELAKHFDGDAPEGEILLIQGIIDVFWLEDDGAVLLDYKTDRVEKADALWDRYETQMDYYSRAITQITGRPVKERVLYSSSLEQETGRL